LRVDDDAMVEALFKDEGTKVNREASQPAEVLPWGIDRIDAELVWPLGNTADPIKVGIIDTGISNKHPDLFANIKGSVNTINPLKSWNDDNGHGSHVAGIVAALDNDIGVIGVGPKINLYAIKVLGANGSGYLSDVIEGIQWAIANNMQVINMSLGTTSDIQSFHDAVISAKNAGIVVVAAAGNSEGAVNFPAAYPEVIAVSATDQNNVIASWSSRGPEVDLSAPGVDIYSTYKGTGYATLSGTSMAAPHVAGTAALVLNTSVGAYDLNGNNKWDPDEVQKKLQDTTTDLGNSGFDNLYGWGLVNAFSAVQ
jgi:subtilisin